MDTAEEIYRDLIDKGFQVLIDDREERPGVKFKDADLIGIPMQLIVGEKNLREGVVEIKNRKTKEAVKVKVEIAVEYIASYSK